MKNGTFWGILLGFTAIFGAFLLEGGKFSSLFLAPAMIIVFGGTIATAMIGTSLPQVARIPRLIALAMFPKEYDPLTVIDQIIRFSSISRREGVLAIERRLGEIEHPYLKKLFQISVDGADPESLRHISETELDFITERHQFNIQMFVRMGGYSPTMGIIGTVMGLIQTLASAGGDPNELIHHIASAFIATMWGIFMANLVWLPIGDKLKTLHDKEMQLLRIMVEGVSSVQIGETPSVIKAKLLGVLPTEEQARFSQEKSSAPATPTPATPMP